MQLPLRPLGRLLVLVLVATAQAGSDAAEPLHYHVHRAVFRASGANRGLAFDGQHLWVGEFGGWVRCYDRDGRPLSKRDLGGGKVQYLGHGVAAVKDFVATGARDFLALFPSDGAPMRRIEPPEKGAVCAVASGGSTLWAMNHESPILYEIDLQGRILRRFTTAQTKSSTSRDIAIDCDGHLYVLAGSGGQFTDLLEYAPDGKLLRTHRLAVSATAVAVSPNDPSKTLYTVTFSGDPIVYEYRLAPGEPVETTLPRLARPPRYRPEGSQFVITNGTHRFNRPLYGSNTAFFIHSGDLPEVMLSLPGKGGTLWLGLVAGEASKWLPAADQVVARYLGGAMRYEIRDGLLGAGALELDVMPMGETEGVVLRVRAAPGTAAVDLVWAFGGASGFNQLNLDTCGYCPESACLLRAEDCKDNRFTITGEGFSLLAPCHQSRPVAGTVPEGAALKVADADHLASPRALLATEGKDRPILAGRRRIEGGGQLLLALEWLPAGRAALKRADLPKAFRAAEAHWKAVSQRVRVTAPDPVFQPAAAAICSAADGLWDPPTYSHGGVRWHFPYLGWRSAYIASEFGWHDRARTHFRAFGRVQLKEPATGKPRPDPARDLARQAPDSVLYTRGYIPVFPNKDARNAYDMQQVYIDILLWHFLWTGDVEFVREMWPVIEDHLAWEKRCFDPDDDGLFENFANTLISDAHHYSGGACTQASAYNYRAFLLAARLAKLIGKDPAPLEQEADKIRAAMNRELWMPELGWYAEYRDLLGLKRLHPSAELPTVYHPIDSDVPDVFQAYQMLRYVDTAIEHIPIEGSSMSLWSSNWVPYIWSVRNVLGSEVAHTALAYWQTGQRRRAFDLYRGAIVDAMVYSHSPGACQGTSDYDAHWTGVATDFSCSVAMFGRTLVEGLYGITPDALDGELLLRPGFPPEWDAASIDTPDAGYTYACKDGTETFDVRARFGRPMRLRLQVPARAVNVAEVTVNGAKAEWKCLARVGEPAIEVTAPAADGAKVQIRWQGDRPAVARCPAVVGSGETLAAGVGPATLQEVKDPQGALGDMALQADSLRATASGRPGHRTAFARVQQGRLSWWLPLDFEIRPPLEICGAAVHGAEGVVALTLRNHTDRAVAGQAQAACGAARPTLAVQVAARSSAALRVPASGLVPGTNPITLTLADGRTVRGEVVDWSAPDPKRKLPFECLDLGPSFNDRVTQIFKNEYRSPRSPYCSLQMPLHGYGDWCYGGKREAPKIDDSRLRNAAGAAGRFTSPQGIPLATPGPGQQPNVVFTSQWDNYPDEVTIGLSGRASHAWFLVAGSTHPMHSQLDNGEIVVTYADGTRQRLPLHNPSTWWPIEADYQLAIDGFCVPTPYPPRIDLGSGRATLLDLPLDASRPLKSLTVRCLANEVVVGLMSATLLRAQESLSLSAHARQPAVGRAHVQAAPRGDHAVEHGWGRELHFGQLLSVAGRERP